MPPVQRLLLLLLIVTLASDVAPAADGAPSPNILFIMSDDHATSAVSAYGSQLIQTPHIDRLAKEGMRFDRCFCTNSICGPSRAVMLTGAYSHINGFRLNGDRFDGTQMTFPRLLQEAGYQTAIVGKWHLQCEPDGFDQWAVLPGQGRYFDPVLIHSGQRKTHEGYVTEIITNLAIDWLKRRDPSRPFCLMVHHKAPHANWEAPERFVREMASRTFPEPATFHDDYAGRSVNLAASNLHVGPFLWDLHYLRGRQESPLPADLAAADVASWVLQRYLRDYLACIASVDENVGRLLNHLDATGLAKNTLVVYTSDQGFFLGEHGLYDKRLMYEPSLQMPLLVRWPGVIEAGRVEDRIVLNLDFAPSLLDAARLVAPPRMQGRSMLPLLQGQPCADWRRAMLYRFYEQAFGIGPISVVERNDSGNIQPLAIAVDYPYATPLDATVLVEGLEPTSPTRGNRPCRRSRPSTRGRLQDRSFWFPATSTRGSNNNGSGSRWHRHRPWFCS